MLRPCRICGVLSHNPRCSLHTRAQQRERATPTQRGYDATHRRLAKQCVINQPWCSLCFSRLDLTADHIIALKDGGLNVASNYRTLCRSCNSARRD